MNLIFDIETGTNENANKYLEPFDPDNPDHIKYGNTKDPVKKAEMARVSEAIYYRQARESFPLNPATGKVLVIGTSVSGNIDIDYLREGYTEKQLLENFWAKVSDIESNQGQLIGFKSKTFDIPFVVRRSWINGVTPYPLMEGKWWKPWVTDLYETWTFSMGRWEMNSKYVRNRLVDVAQILGIGTKDIDIGKNFETVFFNNLESALDYARTDVDLTEKIFNILSDFIRIKNRDVEFDKGIYRE
jgi:hypothetical protein